MAHEIAYMAEVLQQSVGRVACKCLSPATAMQCKAVGRQQICCHSALKLCLSTSERANSDNKGQLLLTLLHCSPDVSVTDCFTQVLYAQIWVVGGEKLQHDVLCSFRAKAAGCRHGSLQQF